MTDPAEVDTRPDDAHRPAPEPMHDTVPDTVHGAATDPAHDTAHPTTPDDVSIPAADAPAAFTIDRRAGGYMQAIAVAGVVVAIVGTAVAWRFLGDLDRNLDRSLVIGEDAAASLVDTIDVADEVVANLDAGLDTLDRTLVTISSTTGETGGVAASAAEIAGRLPENFDDVDTALASVESLSENIDSALRAASRIPLGPDYDPEVPLPQAIGEVRDAFEPIGDDLGELAERLDGFATGTDDLAGDLDAVRADLDATRASLSESDALLERYRVTAMDAAELARTGRDDFDASFGWTRLAVVLLGAFLVVGQYVPWYLGRRLRP
jgi:methyl-accepting chemotaxis protein